MPMSVKCPECDASYKVPDESAGKAIKCKKCGAKVPVPAADDEDDDDFSNLGDKGDGDAKEKKKGSKTLLIVGIVAAVLTCCLCLPGGGTFGVYFFVLKPAAEAAKKLVDEADKKLAAEAGKKLADEAAKKLADAEKERKKFDKDEGGATIFTKKDTLTLKDPRVAKGKPAKTYRVKLEAGKEYIIDMKATGKPFEGDPYLILLDWTNKEVAKDDDSGGFPNAQIRYTPLVTGEFTVQATSFLGLPPNGLPFSLTVKLAK
jgi:predicted Zn finger-like uncharacterized protein